VTTTIKLGFKCLSGTNTLAYYGRKKFRNIGPRSTTKMSARSSGEDYKSWPIECPGASLGWAPALPANIRLGWKGFPGTTL